MNEERRDANEGEGLPELPPVEELTPPPVPPVSKLQSAAPKVGFIGPPRPLAHYCPDADAMCRVWGRYQSRKLGGAVMPLGAKSQLCDSKAIAKYLESPIAIVEPTPDQQVAEQVEITPGFEEAKKGLWLRYVEFFDLTPGLEQTVETFLTTLGNRWPNGFTPEPEKRIRPRAEELKEIQEDVERQRRRAEKAPGRNNRFSG